MIISVLGLDGALGFELMTPGQVFGMANLAAAEAGVAVPPYQVRVCAPHRSITTIAEWGKVEIRTEFDAAGILAADVVIVPGTDRFPYDVDPDVLALLRSAHERGIRVASMCVGAFTIAAAGLLDGRRATTHWQWAEDLATRYPAVEVDAGVLFVDEGSVLTAAGVASGLDLCLELIRQSMGPELASRTARRLVIPSWRDGGQAQFVEHPDPAGRVHPLQSTITWMEGRVNTPLNLDDIAAHASMSVRNLTRQFQIHTGTTPIQMLTQMRVDRARRLLESSHLSVERVANEAGFGSLASLRYHFSRSVGVAPNRYRSNHARPREATKSGR
jgi:transcriptional regulator GlxA family with amidase domain